MKFLSTKIHGVLDYLVAIFLLSMPWLLDFDEGGPAMWVPVVLGASTIVYSLITRYEWGATGIISMKTHLLLDLLSGIFLAASPWIFGFHEYVYIPHVVMGIFEIIASLITKSVPHGETGANKEFYAGPGA